MSGEGGGVGRTPSLRKKKFWRGNAQEKGPKNKCVKPTNENFAVCVAIECLDIPSQNSAKDANVKLGVYLRGSWL